MNGWFLRSSTATQSILQTLWTKSCGRKPVAEAAGICCWQFGMDNRRRRAQFPNHETSGLAANRIVHQLLCALRMRVCELKTTVGLCEQPKQKMSKKLTILYNLSLLGFFLGLSLLVWASPKFGALCGQHFGGVGFLGALVLVFLFFFFVFMRNFYRCLDWLEVRHRAERREKYRGIYRVLSLPSAHNKPASWNAEDITVGDFGWEAEPVTKDGLIWLQGLSVQWKMNWRAGFKPEEVEYVGPKPVSQYDWKDFEYDGPKPRSIYTSAIPKQPCPFPIQKICRWRGQLRGQFPI